MKEILETPVDKIENEFVLEQVEEAVITQEEELVEDLGDAEPPWESELRRTPSRTLQLMLRRILYNLQGKLFMKNQTE